MSDKCKKCQRTIKHLEEQIEIDKLDLISLKENGLGEQRYFLTDLLEGRIEDPELNKKGFDALNQMLEESRKSGIALNEDGNPITVDQIFEKLMKEKLCTSNCDKTPIDDLRSKLRKLELEIFEVELPLLMVSHLKSDLHIEVTIEDLTNDQFDNKFIKELWQELIAEIEMTDTWGPYEPNALGFVDKLILDYKIAKLKNHLSSKEERNKDVKALFYKAHELGQQVFEDDQQVLGDDTKAAFSHWLNGECKAINNMKPVDLLASKNTDGLQLVIDLLGRIEHGVYS